MKNQLKQYRQQMESQIQDFIREGLSDKYRPLLLLAPEGDLKNSFYLRLIAKKMDQFGLQYVVKDPEVFFTRGGGYDYEGPFCYVADTDNFKLPDGAVYPRSIDNIDQGERMSCCAEAILAVVDTVFDGEKAGAGKDAVIVGRGYAVQGLYEELLARDFTVTTCHSKTKYLHGYTAGAELVILATPKTDTPPEQAGAELVIDLNELAPYIGAEIENYFTGSDIGPLTVTSTVLRYCLEENTWI